MSNALSEKIATVFEKLALYLETEEHQKEALIKHNRDETARQVASRVIDVLGDQLDEKTAGQLQNNETALQLLDTMQQKVSELGGPALTSKPNSEKRASRPSPREEVQRVSSEFANWALSE